MPVSVGYNRFAMHCDSMSSRRWLLRPHKVDILQRRVGLFRRERQQLYRFNNSPVNRDTKVCQAAKLFLQSKNRLFISKSRNRLQPTMTTPTPQLARCTSAAKSSPLHCCGASQLPSSASPSTLAPPCAGKFPPVPPVALCETATTAPGAESCNESA